MDNHSPTPAEGLDDFWANRTALIELLRKRGVDDVKINGILRDLLPYIQAYVRSQQRELIEGLLDLQDQETDLDGRAIGGPYHIFSGDYERYVLEQELKRLEAEDNDNR